MVMKKDDLLRLIKDRIDGDLEYRGHIMFTRIKEGEEKFYFVWYKEPMWMVHKDKLPSDVIDTIRDHKLYDGWWDPKKDATNLHVGDRYKRPE